MLKYILLIFTFSIAFPCAGATTTWEGFDLKNCKHWTMTPDDFQGEGENFEKANKLAEEMNSKYQDNHWLVVQGGALYEAGDDLYGVCSFKSSWSVITCAKGINFPLSGATYKDIGSPKRLENFKCIEGCDVTGIKMIHSMGYESEPEDSNVEYNKISAKFELKCHENEKSEKFFEEINKK